MDRKTKDAIKSFVWGVTVGMGGDPEDISNEPDEDVVKALATTLHGLKGVCTDEELGQAPTSETPVRKG